MTREKEGGRERETNVLGARKFISPRGGRGCKPRDGWIFGTMGARAGKGREEEMRKKRWWFSLPCRFAYLRGWSGTGRAYKPHNSPSGDPYPTNFQIINISVAALLRAS